MSHKAISVIEDLAKLRLQVTQQEQQSANNESFNKAVNLLQGYGYAPPKYRIGHPVSLLAGEQIAVFLDFVGPQPKDPRIVEKAKHLLQFAKLGFTLTDHGGQVTIEHKGTYFPVNALIEDLIGPVTTIHGFALSYKNGVVLIRCVESFHTLTPVQAQELAEALDKVSQAAEDEMTPPKTT
jgi:hypothetical protein